MLTETELREAVNSVGNRWNRMNDEDITLREQVAAMCSHLGVKSSSMDELLRWITEDHWEVESAAAFAVDPILPKALFHTLAVGIEIGKKLETIRRNDT